MSPDTIHYRGAYRYADRAALDSALAVALRERGGWRSRFAPRGSSLTVLLDLAAGDRDERRAAAGVLQTLAGLAVEGIVVARQREVAVDVFVRGD